jgi:aspartate/tyrosine/aromatic aminotransferase
VGAYRDADGKPWVFPSVRVVEKLMADDQNLNHEYLALDGLPAFNEKGEIHVHTVTHNLSIAGLIQIYKK